MPESCVLSGIKGSFRILLGVFFSSLLTVMSDRLRQTD